MPSLNPARLSGIAAASLIALILLGLAWELWLAPLRPGGSWLVLKVVPLLFPLFGILHGRLRAYRWTSLLVWPYFAEGVMRAMTEPAPSAILAGIEIALSLSLFLSAAFFARVRSRSA
ncbi:DUF2069 domain-containing protein [Parasulfuritortus cantonensis]|uniref:DUF2069 domain-containing protein n=1 Tax=Parasulfuritortus cantonensis TaxID=2528202 RepID=A0A4R1BPF1_9PROT|nr:DUF2069 domain-containing protein [Parasulfuritortus cantonensis]TCJ19543.1 DUF2069 domain-containing protein [Parasulfuritortus cantonensis]